MPSIAPTSHRVDFGFSEIEFSMGGELHTIEPVLPSDSKEDLQKKMTNDTYRSEDEQSEKSFEAVQGATEDAFRAGKKYPQ